MIYPYEAVKALQHLAWSESNKEQHVSGMYPE